MPNADELKQFPGLTKDYQDAVQLVQAQLREHLASLDSRVQMLVAEQRRRKTVAIILKVVSVLSGLVIATGFLAHSVVQVLGGVIPAIAALERVFANLSRLLAVTAAKNAYERVRRHVVARHDQQIVDVVKIRDTNPKKAADTFIAFAGGLRDKLAAASNEIEEKLSKNDYDNLGRLSLEDDVNAPPRPATPPTPPAGAAASTPPAPAAGADPAS